MQLSKEEARVLYTALCDVPAQTNVYDTHNSAMKKLAEYGGGMHCHYCLNTAETKNGRGYMVCPDHL